MAKRVRAHRFQMPYQVDAPPLTDPEAGIDRVLLRGRHDRRVSTLTLLDTTDERLSWAGVTLAHQVVGESGEWVLQAPNWQPWLPGERVEPFLEGDEIPEEIAELVRPFRRRGTIGPIAGIIVERAAYVLLDADGIELGQVLDDRVTVRRGGLAVSRQREVSFEPTDAMNLPQRGLIVDRLIQAGGMRVEDFPTTADRLAGLVRAADATDEMPTPGQASAEEFCEWLFTGRLFALLRADLQVSGGEVPDTAALQSELAELADVVRGLDALVDPAWAADLVGAIDRVVGQPARHRVRELGEGYLDALDLLASAARVPRLRALPTDEANQPLTARQHLRTDAAQRLDRLVQAVDALTPDADDAAWQHAVDRADDTLRVLNAGVEVLDKVAQRRRRVVKLLSGLVKAVSATPTLGPDALQAMSPAEAFEAGRDYQRAVAQVAEPRRKLLDGWPRVRSKLLADWPEVTGTPEELPAAQHPELPSAEEAADE